MNTNMRAGAVAIAAVSIIAWLNIISLVIKDDRARIVSPLKHLREIDTPHTYDVLFSDLKPLLPRGETVGFYGTAPQSGISTNTAEAARYYQAQYTLCPIVLDYSLDHSSVIAVYDDFTPGMDLGPITNSHDPVAATLSGAVLFKRKQP